MRFCEYCGAALEDGQQCSCPQAQAQQPTQPQQQGYNNGESGAAAGHPTPDYQYQQPGAEGQPSGFNGYGYQQSGAEGQSSGSSGYGYQQSGTEGQPSGSNGYEYQQPSGQSAQNQGQTSQQFAQMGKQVRDTTVHAAKSLKPFFTQYWTSPVQAVRTAVAEKNLILAVTLTAIRVVVVIALLWSMVGKVGGILSGGLWALSALTGSFGSRLSMTVRGALGSIGFGFLIAVLGMALFTLMLFVLTRIFKSGGSILDVYIANSVNGVVTTAILLLAFVCSLFSMGFGLGLVLLACFAAVIFGSLSAQAVCGEQSSGLYWGCYLAGVAVVLLVSWWLMPNMVLQVVKGLAFG